MSGDHGNKWLSGQAPVKSTSNYNIVIEGLRGSGYQGDIAIDDLSFTDSLCGGMSSLLILTFLTLVKPCGGSLDIKNLTGVVISYEIYETNLWQVS